MSHLMLRSEDKNNGENKNNEVRQMA